MTITATYEGTEIARSDRTVVVEGNHYFPAEDVLEGTLQPSDTHSICPWKGEASYYDVVVGEKRNHRRRLVLPGPKDAAKEIADRVAFWKGIRSPKAERRAAQPDAMTGTSGSGESSGGAWSSSAVVSSFLRRRLASQRSSNLDPK